MGDEKIVSYDEMKSFENSDKVLIIDVRREEEVMNTGKIGGSINIPSEISLKFITHKFTINVISVDNLENELKNVSEEIFKQKYGTCKPEKDFPLIFTCLMGGRAARAADIAVKLGYIKYTWCSTYSCFLTCSFSARNFTREVGRNGNQN